MRRGKTSGAVLADEDTWWNARAKTIESLRSASTPRAVDAQASADDLCNLGDAAMAAGDPSTATQLYCRAIQLVPRFGRAVTALQRHATEAFAQAIAVRDSGDLWEARRLLVRSIELNPFSGETRAEYDRLFGRSQQFDLTKTCYVHLDPVRGEATERDAVQRCLDYVNLAGVGGEIMEFGVLGGWSARIFAETMRDTMCFSELHLFDSFEGLPSLESEVDRSSFEIAGRNIWPENMRFGEDVLTMVNNSIPDHVWQRLSNVISDERVYMHPGFFSDVLVREDVPRRKTALVHLDCDLYQSTLEVLEGLQRLDSLQDGCLLMFDDWNCNKASPSSGQRRALIDFLGGAGRDFCVSPFFTYGANGSVFFLHSRPVPKSAGLIGIT